MSELTHDTLQHAPGAAPVCGHTTAAVFLPPASWPPTLASLTDESAAPAPKWFINGMQLPPWSATRDCGPDLLPMLVEQAQKAPLQRGMSLDREGANDLDLLDDLKK